MEEEEIDNDDYNYEDEYNEDEIYEDNNIKEDEKENKINDLYKSYF
jgi:hypothetical protein